MSFGVTEPLLKFWKRASFVPVYLRLVWMFINIITSYIKQKQIFIFSFLRQTTNDITGEHSCIMLYKINSEQDAKWLQAYWNDFRKRFINLLSISFNMYSSSLALSILINKSVTSEITS